MIDMFTKVIDFFISLETKQKRDIDSVRECADEFAYTPTRENRIKLLKALRKLYRLYDDYGIVQHHNQLLWLIDELERFPERDKHTLHNIYGYCKHFLK